MLLSSFSNCDDIHGHVFCDFASLLFLLNVPLFCFIWFQEIFSRCTLYLNINHWNEHDYLECFIS